MQASVTIIIIVITCVASFYAWNNPSVLSKWMMNPYAVYRRREYHRLVTSGFIHNDIGHLFFNMFTLYFFGDVIEQVFGFIFGIQGTIIFVVFYLLGIVVSDIPTLIKHKNNSNYNALGASGGVSAVVFCSILFYPLGKICLFPGICLPGFLFGALYIIYSWYSGKQMRDNVNHDAHLYGALFGVLAAILVHPPVIFSFFEQILSFRIF